MALVIDKVGTPSVRAQTIDGVVAEPRSARGWRPWSEARCERVRPSIGWVEPEAARNRDRARAERSGGSSIPGVIGSSGPRTCAKFAGFDVGKDCPTNPAPTCNRPRPGRHFPVGASNRSSLAADPRHQAWMAGRGVRYGSQGSGGDGPWPSTAGLGSPYLSGMGAASPAVCRFPLAVQSPLAPRVGRVFRFLSCRPTEWRFFG